MKSKLISSSTIKKPYLEKLQMNMRKSKDDKSLLEISSEEKISDNRIINRLRTISIKSKKKVEEKREEEERKIQERNNISISSEEEKEGISEEEEEKRLNEDEVDMKARNNLLLYKKANAHKAGDKNIYDIERLLPLLSYGKMATLEMNTYGVRKSNVFHPGDGAAILNMLPNLMNAESKLDTSISSYLNNLSQNKSLEPGTITEIDPHKLQIKTSKYFTFFRIEHEISDLFRKNNDFEESRQVYMEKKNENLKESYAELIRQSDPFKTSEKIKKLKEYKKGLEIARKYVPVQKKKAGKEAMSMAEQFINDSRKLTLTKSGSFINPL